MLNETITDALVVLLALMLVWAAVVDVRTFTISNKLNLAIALMAPLTLAVLGLHRARKKEGRPEVPYGVAIAFGGLWLLAQRFLNQFA